MFTALFYVTKEYLNLYFSKRVLYPVRSMWQWAKKVDSANLYNQPGTASEHLTQAILRVGNCS